MHDLELTHNMAMIQPSNEQSDIREHWGGQKIDLQKWDILYVCFLKVYAYSLLKCSFTVIVYEWTFLFIEIVFSPFSPYSHVINEKFHPARLIDPPRLLDT